MYIKIKNLSLVLLLYLGFLGHAQNHLDRYIKLCLTNNEVIRQKSFDINKSLFALKEAQSLFILMLLWWAIIPLLTVEGP